MQSQGKSNFVVSFILPFDTLPVLNLIIGAQLLPQTEVGVRDLILAIDYSHTHPFYLTEQLGL